VKFEVPAEGIPGALKRDDLERWNRRWSEEQCIEIMAQFLELVADTSGIRPTTKTYNIYAPERGWPATKVYMGFGGFSRIREKARKRLREGR
jgi:hypothetical protein